MPMYTAVHYPLNLPLGQAYTTPVHTMCICTFTFTPLKGLYYMYTVVPTLGYSIPMGGVALGQFCHIVHEPGGLVGTILGE